MITQENAFVLFQYENERLRITVKHKTPTDEEWAETKKYLLSYYDAHLQKGKRFAIICNMHDMCVLPIYRVVDWSKLFREHAAQTKQCVLYTIFLTDSSLIKTSMTIFFKMYTPVRPTVFLESEAQIEQWVKQNQPADK
jgi:hypothetical protein